MIENLADKWADVMAQEIQKEIDWEILSDLLVMQGWTKVDLPPFSSRYQAVDISNWVEDNCQGQFKEFKQFGRTFVFKEAKDATAFALKWM